MSLPEPIGLPVRPALDRLPESDPEIPHAELARRAGVERLVCLALNEGQFGPFPNAVEALALIGDTMRRYPTRGSTELVEALARQLGVAPKEVLVTAGADAAIGYIIQTVIEPGDEVVVAWPSFPSFERDPVKRDAVPVLVPLADHRVDVGALLAAVTPQTRLLFIATPNNPTGLVVGRAELDALLHGLPADVLPVIDEAYFDYVDPATRVDAVEVARTAGRPVLVLRTFSKLYGLAGLRIGYIVGPAAVLDGIRKVQRGYDVSLPAQIAALASLGDKAEIDRRRELTRTAVAELATLLASRGLEPLPEPRGNFVFVDVGTDSEPLFEALLALGVLVQPTRMFGDPHGLRITAGTPDDLAALDAALAQLGR